MATRSNSKLSIGVTDAFRPHLEVTGTAAENLAENIGKAILGAAIIAAVGWVGSLFRRAPANVAAPQHGARVDAPPRIWWPPVPGVPPFVPPSRSPDGTVRWDVTLPSAARTTSVPDRSPIVPWDR